MNLITALRHTRGDLPGRRAENRMSAVVYGDILVLAATAGVSWAMITSGEALLVLAGTLVSTYVAHVLADVVGSLLSGHDLAATVTAELRDSVPILSAGVLPLALFLAARAGWPPPGWAQAAACGALVVRIAAIGLVYRHLRERVSWSRAVWSGVVIAAVAAVSVSIKLALTH